MKTCRLGLCLVVLIAATRVRAHEGHDTPGALPTAPFGGRLGAAEDDGSHEHSESEHEHEDESEIFVEVKLVARSLKIFAHKLEEKDPSTFVRLTPGREVALKSILIEQPREKKSSTVPFTLQADHWEASIASIAAKRLMVHLTLQVGDETKKAKVQLERY